MAYAFFIIVLASIGSFIVGISTDAFYIMLAICLAALGICQEISKLKDKLTDKKDNDDKKE